MIGIPSSVRIAGAILLFVREAIKAAAGGVNIENLMSLAKTAEESFNWSEAYKYYSKVLEYDQKNSEAWIGKGISSLLKTSHGVEAKICWAKAYSLKSEAEAVKFYKKAWEISRHDKRITGIILTSLKDKFLSDIGFRVELKNQLYLVKHYLEDNKILVDFVNELNPNDRVVEKSHSFHNDYEYNCKTEKEDFNRLLKEVQSVDPSFKPSKIADCFKSGWFSW